MSRLHAKMYVGEAAATLGSSNFTGFGLDSRIRSQRAVRSLSGEDSLPRSCIDGPNFWEAGAPWDEEIRSLLGDLIQVVSWEEALARACAELLEGMWAETYMKGSGVTDHELWPSQRSGIAEDSGSPRT